MDLQEASSKYFESIAGLLSDVADDITADSVRWSILYPVKELRKDFGFLKVFSWWLETWDFTTDDEEITERLRSIITSLKVIWPKEVKSLSLPNRLRDDMWMQNFHSATFELEAKIQQSQLQVERWTEILMHSSLQYKFSTVSVFQKFLDLVWFCLRDLLRNYGAAPLNKQIGILMAKMNFLKESFYKVDCMGSREKILPFLNFIGDYANSVASLTFLYWLKGSSEETAAEMNIVLFHMMQKFIPFASDIIPLNIDIQKSYDSHPSDSSLESFVDFFFGHLVTVLKDDFLVLRDRLIFLFTFLTDPPCENAQEEELIRDQIYALLREEDAYLLLSFDVMKEDFSSKKMLLSDCMIKIDITIAKVRQIYCGFSDSWIKLEVEKMEWLYFVSVDRELSWIEKYAEWADLVISQLQLYRMELRFLRVFLLCSARWDDTDIEVRVRLRSMITSFQEIWEKEEEIPIALRLHAMRTEEVEEEEAMTFWHPLASELEEKVQLSKLEIKARWVNLVHWPPLTSYEILRFLESILECLNDLVRYKASEIDPFKKQIGTLEDKLVFLKNFLKLARNCIYCTELEEFKLFVQVFAYDAICLTFLYWAKDANDSSASETNNMLSDMLQNIKPARADVARLYFGTLKAIYMQRSDSLMFGQTALSFVDFFLIDPVTPLKDDFQILRDDIIFFLTFLNDPPNQNAVEVICGQIDVLFWEGLCGLLPFADMEEDFSKKRVLLSDVMMKIETVNANIRQIYCKILDPSVYNFPKIIYPQFLDFLLRNLKNLKDRMISDHKYAPFAKYKIIKIEEELVSLRPFLNYIFDLQSELNELWSEVVDFVHLTKHIIDSCISSWFVFDHPIWYHMARLFDVIDLIKVVRTKLEKIKENMYNARCLPRINTLLEQARPSHVIETIVGFEDEAKNIIDMLTTGSMSLDIVSIVGMGGLGKTTLAKKVYGSSSVQSKFNVFALCIVSREHNARKLLCDILHDIMGDDKIISNMSDDDLAHQLWKCLSRRKYLILLDDVWNESAWNEVQRSFPNDKNGSRVMLTTRSYEVAEKCKINCSPYQLRFLSEVESWELLQKIVFHNVISPSFLNIVGKRIAKNCKGLPLAVVVIAGLLARTKEDLIWWSKVDENVVSYLFDEGCMKILELSYNHLPETLKPCLLYLGAFPEDERIRVKKVIQLWIAEGFVQESKTKCIEDVAKEYLHDLLGRSLVTVSERSSNSELKEVHVHDLIRDLCHSKCREVNFFQLDHKIASSCSSDLSINNHYRVSTVNLSGLIVGAGSSISNVRSVLSISKIFPNRLSEFRLREFRLVQVLDSRQFLQEYDLKQLCSLVHLRHIYADFSFSVSTSVPRSICNIWDIGSLTLNAYGACIHMPDTIWRMKSLRHVQVENCILKFSDGPEDEAYPKLDNVVSFSKPVLYTGKDVQRLLQRLPAVRKLSCCFEESLRNDEEAVEKLDFHRELESMKLKFTKKRQYLISFPPTLKKLTLESFQLTWTDISAIAELHYLEVLKLRWVSIQGTRLKMEDLAFQSLKFLELGDFSLVEWNASTESLPCLEQLVIKYCRHLEGLPPCFGEMPTLKRIFVRRSSEVLKSSALQIQDELMQLGITIEVSILNR